MSAGNVPGMVLTAEAVYSGPRFSTGWAGGESMRTLSPPASQVAGFSGVESIALWGCCRNCKHASRLDSHFCALETRHSRALGCAANRG